MSERQIFNGTPQAAQFEAAMVALGVTPGCVHLEDDTWTRNVADSMIGFNRIAFRATPSWVVDRWSAVAKKLIAFGWKPNLADEQCFTRALESVGEDFVKRIEEIGLAIIYLPGRTLSRKTTSDKLPGYVNPLNEFYWNSLEGGRLLLPRGDKFVTTKTAQPGRKKGQVLVIDTRCKPSYTDGSQMWFADTFLGGTIEGLRKAGTIPTMNWCSADSRFGVSAIEYETIVAAALNADERFARKIHWVGAELACQWSVIDQIYTEYPRANDGTTSGWIILRERFSGGSDCLIGGNSGSGGLSYVGYGNAGDHWNSGSGRPLGVLKVA